MNKRLENIIIRNNDNLTRYKAVIIAVLAVLAYTQLYDPLVRTLLTDKAAPYLQIRQTLQADLVFGTFLLYAIYLAITRVSLSFTGFRSSWSDLFWPSIICSLYLFHRMKAIPSGDWSFQQFRSVPFLYYADGAVLLTLVLLFRPREILRPNEPDTSLPALLEDDLMNRSPDTDILKRSGYADYMAKLVMNLRTGNTFAIGVKGSWGSGKSAFLRQVEKKLKNVIVIRFNPWLSKKEDDVLVDFFKVLIERTGIYNNDLSRKLERYYTNLANIDENFGKKILSTLGIIRKKSEQGTEEQQRSIAETIRRNQLKLAVFIDDLDRLNAAEVLSVLKLIRNSLNFPNTVFLIAYDEKYVTSILKQQIKHPEKFIEKIFQLEIDLPSVPSFIIEQQLEALLMEAKTDKQKGKIRNGLNALKDYGLVAKGISNIRDAIRFSNAVNHLFWKKEEETDTVDLMALELLKLKNRTLFLELRDALLGNASLEYLNYPIGDTVLFTGDSASSDPDRKLGEMESSLFSLLFSRGSDFDQLKSIRFTGNALRYFSDDLFGNISFRDFDRYREPDFTGFRSVIDEQVAKDNTAELAAKISRISIYPDQHAFFNLNKGLMYLPMKTGNHPETVYYNLRDNFASLHTFIPDPSLFAQYLERLLTDQSTDAVTESKVLGRLLNITLNSEDAKRIDFPKENLVRLIVKNLTAFTKKYSSSFNAGVFDIYYQAIDRVEKNQVIILGEANEVLKQYVTANKETYFTEWLIRPKFTGTINPDLYVLEPYIDQYLGYGLFEELLYSMQPSTSILKLQGFYEKYKASGYTEAVYRQEVIEIQSNERTVYEGFLEVPEGKIQSSEIPIVRTFPDAPAEIQGAASVSRIITEKEMRPIQIQLHRYSRNIDLSKIDGNIYKAELFLRVFGTLSVRISGKTVAFKLEHNIGYGVIDVKDFLGKHKNKIEFDLSPIPLSLDQTEILSINPSYGFSYSLHIWLK